MAENGWYKEWVWLVRQEVMVEYGGYEEQVLLKSSFPVLSTMALADSF